MRNKGLLTGRGSPLAFTKDPLPADLPNRVMARSDIAETAPTSQEPAKAAALLQAGRSPKVQAARASENHDHRQRYKLFLALDPAVVTRLEALLSGLDASTRPKAMRKLVSGFAATLDPTDVRKADYAPENAQAHLLHLTITTAHREAILSVEGAHPLEPTATVLARNLAPLFHQHLMGITLGQ